YPGGNRVGRGPAGDVPAIHLHGAGVRRDDARQNPHQRALPGAVLTHKGVDLASGHLERCAMIGHNGTETLVDSVQSNDWRRCRGTVLHAGLIGHVQRVCLVQRIEGTVIMPRTIESRSDSTLARTSGEMSDRLLSS